MRTLLWIAASLSAVTCSAQTTFAQDQLPADTTAVIASWNIEGYGGIEDDEKIDRLAAGLVALDAELIALQEVNPDSVAQRLVERANALGADYASPVILEQEAQLNLAILHKNGVSVGEPRFVPGSNLGDPALRKALAADVRVGRFDVTLIVVHLKSGRGGADRDTRTAQARVVNAFITQLAAAGDDDVLLVGDYNMIPDADRETFLALDPEGFLRFLSTYQAEQDFTNVNGNFLDGYAVTRRRMTEYVEGSFRVYPLHKAYDRTMTWYGENVSDHFPLVARFHITRDAD